MVVSALNIGSHSSVLRPSPIGFPNNTGSDPGARGAQLRGKLIQDPHPNPHASQSIRFCVVVSISLLAWASNPILS